MPLPEVVPFVDLAAQYASLKDEIGSAIQRVLTSCDFILGSAVEEFEQAFADFIDVRYAVGVASGLDALRVACAALEIGPGDEVIVPANTYIATALAVSAVGATPVFVDCNAETYGIDVSQVEQAVTPKVRAIIPVHLTGQAVDMDPLLRIAEAHHLFIIEDAAQAHGTVYKGRPCGSMGAIGCFSFYPGKNLGAYGDGGLATTNDPSLAERMRRLRNYGQRKKYEHTNKGLNSRLDTLQAAILNVKLRHLPEWNRARVEHARRYRELLAGVPGLRIQSEASYSSHIYHLFVVESEERDVLQRALQNDGVATGIHYPKPVHLQPAYADLNYRDGQFPSAERLAGRMLSLPMYPELGDHQIEYVARCIRGFLAESGRRAVIVSK